MKVTIENVRKHDKGLLRGFFDLKMDGLMTICGCSVFCKTTDAGASWWISMPSRAYTDKDGGQKYQTIVEMPSDRLQSLRDLVMPELKAALGAPEQAPEPVAKHRQWHSTEKGAKGAKAVPSESGWAVPDDAGDLSGIGMRECPDDQIPF